MSPDELLEILSSDPNRRATSEQRTVGRHRRSGNRSVA